jgi:hypothetical protein
MAVGALENMAVFGFFVSAKLLEELYNRNESDHMQN